MSERFLTRKRLRDLVIVLSAASAFFFPVTNIQTVAAGLILLFGTFIHFVAKGTLVRNEVVCIHGIYGVVRHPYYLANYLVDSAFCLISGNNYLLLLYPFLFFWSYGPTLRKEEKFLTQKHGGSSLDYIFGTPALFPDTSSIRYLPALFDAFSFRRISRKEIARIIRFYGVSVLLLLLHEISLHPLDVAPSAMLSDIPVLLLLSLAFALFGANLLILRTRRESL